MGKMLGQDSGEFKCPGNPFFVNERSVRERYFKLESAYKRKTDEEKRANGISSDSSELDFAVEEIIERKESGSSRNKVRRNHDKRSRSKKESAEEVSRKAMENISQTQEREGKRKIKCGESGYYLDYFKEKDEVRRKVENDHMTLQRKKKLKLKREKLKWTLS